MNLEILWRSKYSCFCG